MDPGDGREPLLPCREGISCGEGFVYCRDGLCEKTGLSLPTEAEWEYACRGGSDTRFAFGDRVDPNEANFDRSRGKPVRVHLLEPNGFGLHHMHGNVWEWCRDIYDPYFYDKAEAAMLNPISETETSRRRGQHVTRGGSWMDREEHCRSALRGRMERGEARFHVGFRPTCPVP